MGSGKSTLGRALAERVPIRFIDLDDFIEHTENRSVSRIFAEEGETGFRRIERQALRRVASEAEASDTPVLIACGGGTPCFFDNMEFMNSRGTTVLLDASLDALHRRLSLMRAGRPIIARLSESELRGFISEALDSRMPHYSKAQLTFQSDRLENETEIAESVDAFMRLCPFF